MSSWPRPRAEARRWPGSRCLALSCLLLGVGMLGPAVARAVPPQQNLGDGGWCWFADPRGIHYEGAHKRTYLGWVARNGDIDVAAFDHDSGVRTTAVVHRRLEVD